MGKPVAKQGDRVVAIDTHIVLVSTSGGQVPTPMPLPFDGQLDQALADSVYVDDKPVALVDSVASNAPAHVALGGTFQTPPKNRGTVTRGSETVFVGGRALARDGDAAETCNDPADAEVGRVVASGTVSAG